jgi:acyl carrier protein
MAPKVHGVYNLHAATSEHALDFFLLFASVAGVVGSAGQAPYAAANAFLDAFAHWRRQRGLSAQSIDWGGWGEVGMSVRGERAEVVRRSGGKLMSPADGAEMLERVMADASVQVAVMDMDFRHWGELNPRAASARLLLDVMPKAGTRIRTDAAGQAFRAKLQAAVPSARGPLVEDFVRTMLGELLRVKKDDLRFDAPLRELGFDSLMFVSMRNEIGRRLGVTISAASIMAAANGRELSARILALAEKELCAAPRDASGPAVEESPKAAEGELQRYLESLVAEGYVGKRD